MKRLNDIFPDFDSFKGLFSAIQTNFGTDDDNNPLLWPDDDSTSLEDKDFEFYSLHAKKWVTTAIEALDEAGRLARLPNVICAHFGSNWEKLYNAYFVDEYNPIENYSMKEVREPDLEEKIDTEANSKVESKTESGVYGFNSSEAVPATTADNTTEGLKTNNFGSSTKTNKGKETLTRAGNIGTMTSQMMLQSELDIRKFDYWKRVFDDLDKIFCLGVY